jgi:Cdc6-like AAA superfamily ATPase
VPIPTPNNGLIRNCAKLGETDPARLVRSKSTDGRADRTSEVVARQSQRSSLGYEPKMTSTDIVKGEIERFLKSTEPEVLCITGEWGVGKTYTWQTILDRLRRKREVGLSRYSYVSLFGIASLDAFKSTIFENLEFLVPEGTSGLDWIKSGGNAVLRHGKKVAGLAAGTLPYVGNAIGGAQPLLFSGVRNQIVCIDDLERKGAISVKDVFGLISFLREQRGCKVVLLLNQNKLNESEESRKEFDDYFEKVIDTRWFLHQPRQKRSQSPSKVKTNYQRS